MKPRVKTEVIAVRLDPTLKERAEELAARDRRTMSSWVEVLIADRVAASRKRGRDPVMARQTQEA